MALTRLYEAANTIEAYMMLGLLQQSGIKAHIHGEHLQSGIGELSALTSVSVMVNETDYQVAKTIVNEWEENQVTLSDEPINESEKGFERKSKATEFFGFLFSVGLGAALTWGYFHVPKQTEKMDLNGDGKIDQVWQRYGDGKSKLKSDHNFDGAYDAQYYYDQQGLATFQRTDLDFNGSFETKLSFQLNNVISQETDTNGDGFNDYRMSFKHGRLDSISFYDSTSKKLVKVQSYNPVKLSSAKLDSNRDGVLDTIIYYDEFEEISKTEKIRQ